MKDPASKSEKPISAVKTAVTPNEVADILKTAGYRANVVEHQQFPQVQSAAQGLGFFVGFGNSAPGEEGTYVDFSFHCWITLQGEFAAQTIDSWNQTRRFARLYRQGQLLILTMDVMVAGGVTDAFLLAQTELWDRVIRDFIRHLQQPPQAVAPNATDEKSV